MTWNKNRRTKLGTDNRSALSKGKNLLSSKSTDLKCGAKSGSSRLVGDRAEAKVDETLEKVTEVKATKNSGATHEDGDRVIAIPGTDDTYIRAEVKYRNSIGFTVQKKHWKDIVHKALVHGGIPALIVQNNEKKNLVVMDLEDFSEILAMTTRDDK